ncbi:hypothetical protein D3C71_1749620 [compost metagenome]
MEHGSALGGGMVAHPLSGRCGAGVGAVAIELRQKHAQGAGPPPVSGHGPRAAGFYRAGRLDKPGAHAHRGGHRAQLWPVTVCP